MNCDCGCHDSPSSDFEMRLNGCDVCADAHRKQSADVLTTDILKQGIDSLGGIPAIPVKAEDEFGDLNVQSDARMAKLKGQANEHFRVICETIKKSQSAISGFAEWARTAEANEKRFHDVSKAYVETLKAIEGEQIKTRF